MLRAGPFSRRGGRTPSADVVRAASVLMGANEPMLNADKTYGELRTRVNGKGVQLYVREPLDEDAVARAALISLSSDEKGSYVDGFVATSSEILPTVEGRGDLFAAPPRSR